MVKTVAVVSLSAGTIGEDFVKHELEIGLRRLWGYNLSVRMMPHALLGREYVKNHPAERAADLIEALCDDSIDLILCAIGGDDTYRLLPYLFAHDELKNAVQKAKKGKLFLGFSDTTMNHFMLNNVGFKTFYGQSFLADICELDREMLPYSAHYFEELLRTGTVSEIRPSDVWYEERTDFSFAAVGTPHPSHENEGYQLLQGPAKFSGEFLGGCIDSIFDVFDSSRYEDTEAFCSKYGLFPKKEDWKGKILLLETSEEQPTPAHYRKMFEKLKAHGVLDTVNGIVLGKPMNELYMEEYKKIAVEVTANQDVPILANFNVGHALPRCIIPFGVPATVDAETQVVRFSETAGITKKENDIAVS